jgi:hypothetical protein
MYSYISFQVWEGLLQIDDTNVFVNSMRDFIKFDDWYTFPGYNTSEWRGITLTAPYGFNDWAEANKYEYGVGHPMEKAHEDAAELIYERVREIIK